MPEGIDRRPGEDDATYFRRRLDAIGDQRMIGVEKRLERLEARMNYLFGALAILTVLANLFGPEIAKAVAP